MSENIEMHAIQKRKTGYYWVKLKSTVNREGTGIPNVWGIFYFVEATETLNGRWCCVLNDLNSDDWTEEINETRIAAPDENRRSDNTIIIHNQIPDDYFKELEDKYGIPIVGPCSQNLQVVLPETAQAGFSFTAPPTHKLQLLLQWVDEHTEYQSEIECGYDYQSGFNYVDPEELKKKINELWHG